MGTTKHLSLKCQDGFLGALSLDRGTVADGCQVPAVVLSSKSCNKGMCCSVLNGKLWDTEDCNLCPAPSAGSILRNIPRLLEPVGRDFERSEVTHSLLCKRGHSSETGLLGFTLPTQCWAHKMLSIKAMQ